MNSENCKLREKPNHIIIKSHGGVAGSWPRTFIPLSVAHTERLKLPPHDFDLSKSGFKKNRI